MSEALIRVHLAPAKLTLTLRVLGTRPDGFHEIEALTVMISAPVDSLRMSAAPAGVVDLTVIGGSADIPHDDTNLVVRAARAVLPASAGIRIELTKRIPSGAGLGGGSADAGAVLRVLRDEHGIADAAVMAAAAELGSDVPVCVRGVPVFMRGRGEQLEAVSINEDLYVVVAKPPFSLATPPVFRAWDALGSPRSDRAVPAPRAVTHLVDELVNDLEPAAVLVEPRIQQFREALEAAAGLPAVLAGSGSSYFVPVADAVTANEIGARVAIELGVETFVGRVARELV